MIGTRPDKDAAFGKFTLNKFQSMYQFRCVYTCISTNRTQETYLELRFQDANYFTTELLIRTLCQEGCAAKEGVYERI